MNDDAAKHQAPTLPAIPLRSHQRHRARSKKETSSRWLARRDPPAAPSSHVEELPRQSPPFATTREERETLPSPAIEIVPIAVLPPAVDEDDRPTIPEVLPDEARPTVHERVAARREAAAAEPTFPPARDTTPDPVAAWEEGPASFFREGESLSPVAHAEAAAELVEEPPPVPHRPRRGLALLVGGAVALAALVCVAALAAGRPGVPAGIAVAAVRSPSAAAAPAKPTLPAKTAPAASIPSAPSAARSAASIPSAPSAAPSAAEPVPSGKELREQARSLLSGRHVGAAVTAAEAATRAEPTEAEGWLLLGAAELEAGHAAEAAEAFRACTREANHGNIGECRAFAR